MRWVVDTSGRFRWRPWLDKGEIDVLCEDRVRRFLHARHGVVAYPVSTDDLTRLIEQEVDDLDLYADLHDETGTSVVEGMTLFVWGGRPRVRIARALYEDGRRGARLRTTLAHELGHVLLHNFVGDREDGVAIPVSDEHDTARVASCGLTVVPGQCVDWMEWQAGYACGALLMPRTALKDVIRLVLDETGHQIPVTGAAVGRLIDRVQGHFLVSAAAAHTRLRHLGHVPSVWSQL